MGTETRKLYGVPLDLLSSFRKLSKERTQRSKVRMAAGTESLHFPTRLILDGIEESLSKKYTTFLTNVFPEQQTGDRCIFFGQASVDRTCQEETRYMREMIKSVRINWENKLSKDEEPVLYGHQMLKKEYILTMTRVDKDIPGYKICFKTLVERDALYNEIKQVIDDELERVSITSTTDSDTSTNSDATDKSSVLSDLDDQLMDEQPAINANNQI